MVRKIIFSAALSLFIYPIMAEQPVMESENLLNKAITAPSPEDINNPEAFYNAGWKILSGNGENLEYSSSKGWSCFSEVENNYIQWGPYKDNLFVGETADASVITLQYWDEELLPQPNTEDNIKERINLEYAHYVYPVDLDSSKYYFYSRAGMLTSNNNGSLTPQNLYNLFLVAFSPEPLSGVTIDVDPDRSPMVELKGTDSTPAYVWKVLPRPKNSIPQIVEIPWTELSIQGKTGYVNIFAPGQLILIDQLELHKGISTGVSSISENENRYTYYNLTGTFIGHDSSSLKPGMYIRLSPGGSSEKIMLQ